MRVATQNFPFSIAYDGAAGYTYANTSVGATYANPYSIEMWMKWSHKQALSDSTIFSNGSTTNANTRLRFNVTGDSVGGKIVVEMKADDASFLINNIGTTTNYTTNRWHHIVWTDAGGTCKMYVDGVADATNFTYTPTNTFTANTIATGAYLRVSVLRWSRSSMALLRTYGSALSAAQVVDRLNGRGISIQPTLEWLPTAGSGTTITDTSGNGRNGTIVSASWSQDSPSKVRTAAISRVKAAARSAAAGRTMA